MSDQKYKKVKKYKRRFNPKLIKHSRNYSTQEIANLLNTTVNTVSNWYKIGLKKIDDKKPSLVFGKDLINFLRDNKTKRKQRCAPNEFYCCKCKSPRKAWENAVDITYLDLRRLMISGICEQCGNKINKLAATKNIEELKKVLNFQVIRNKQL